MDEKDLVAVKRKLLTALGCPAERVAKLNSAETLDALIEEYEGRKNAKHEEEGPEMATPEEVKKKEEADAKARQNLQFLKPSQANIPVPEEHPVPEQDNDDKQPPLEEHFDSVTTRNAMKYNSSARVLRLYSAEYPDGRVF